MMRFPATGWTTTRSNKQRRISRNTCPRAISPTTTISASVTKARSMLHDPKQIEAALTPLVGLPLCLTRRSADIHGFHFGELRDSKSKYGPRKGQSSQVGEYVLHVQCAWRIVGEAGVLVGSRDAYYRAGADPIPDEGEILTTTRSDERLAFVVGLGSPVTSVRADVYGGLDLRLSSGHRLEIFPNDSVVTEHTEHWRLFPTAEVGMYIVVSSKGVIMRNNVRKRVED
jgi:hypothetical protein